ncbi:hypothetical protein D3C78_1824290 [compost metagenome]
MLGTVHHPERRQQPVGPFQFLQALAGQGQNLVAAPGHGLEQARIDAAQAEQHITAVLGRAQHRLVLVQRLAGG